MNKPIAIIMTSLLWASSSAVLAQEQKPSQKSDLFEQFDKLSSQALNQIDNASIQASATNTEFNNPSIFIERETTNSLAQNGLLAAPESDGQWSVSFDLNRLGFSDQNYNFNTEFDSKNAPGYDWELGTSLVSPDRTSRFYVNYGNRKVPISISFDDLASSFPQLQEEALNVGFEQKLNESWAVSIAYLKGNNNYQPEHQLTASSAQQLNYLFDFSDSNKLETVNFAPFSQDLTPAGLLDDISAIQIKVSRQMSDSLLLSASASQERSDLVSGFGLELADLALASDENSLKSQQLSLEGQYKLTDSWSFDANLEHQVDQLSAITSTSLGDFNQLDSTTLDIGVQYQSNWDQVGVVIRIDLMNLLGVSQTQAGQMGLDQTGLKPFSFDSPKYIKVSGSINF